MEKIQMKFVGNIIKGNAGENLCNMTKMREKRD